MSVLIGHASSDENKKIKGGKVGDQTQKEVCTRAWYSEPWTIVFRPKTSSVAEKIAVAMEQACSNDNVGYDQSQRTTLYTHAKSKNWDLSKITVKCECDCSALVSVCINAAGIPVDKNMYTGNEEALLRETGKFKVLTSKKYVCVDTSLKRGDILLGNGHTAVVLSDGKTEQEEPKGGNNVAFRIALSAGHGKNTAGKRCLKRLDRNETREWVLNDRIADKIEKRLNEYDGYELLRVDDTTGVNDVALRKRSNAANEFKADFYLAIHHNAGVNGGSGGGIVAFVYIKPDRESVEWQNELYDELIRTTGLKGNRATPLGRANFHEVREPKMPAVLLELGFMDSKVDVPIILSEKFADQCAEAITRVIVKRGGLKKKTAAKPTTDAATYKVRVIANSLMIRSGAGTTHKAVGKITDKGVYTVVEESKNGKWGLLKAYADDRNGWISLNFKYVERV